MEALKFRPDDETTFVPKAPGAFDRGACRVQGWIENAASGQESVFGPEPNRYHIFVNYGCGWCHQLLMVRALRGLHSSISVTQVGLYRGTEAPRGSPAYQGFMIADGADGPSTGSGEGFTCMREIYNAFDGTYGTDQLTTPVLFDKKTRRVVSNDPAQMLLMLDFWADELRGEGLEAATPLYPEALREQIEAANAVIYPGINNGVYCAWFGGDVGKPGYEEGFELVQSALKWFDARLAEHGGPFLIAETEAPTLADVRAFPHLFRFDGIYWELMLRRRGTRISSGDLPHLAAWVARMFAIPEVRSTCDLQVATRFYFSSLPVAESDAIYDREREAAEVWLPLPSREEWAEKRRAEGVTEEMIFIPNSRI